MLLSGLQMLPLLWLLLWTHKSGVSSILLPDYVKKALLREPWYSLQNKDVDKVTTEPAIKTPETNFSWYEEVVTQVPMVDINNEIYEQFKKSRQNVFMVFNKTKLKEAVPNPSLLHLAELHLFRLKEHQRQTLVLYQRHRVESWKSVSFRILTRNDTSISVWFDVTEVVRQWMNPKEEDRGPFEMFCLREEFLGEEEEKALHTDFSGLTPSGPSDHPHKDNSNRPFLLLLNYRRKKAQTVNSSQQP